MLDASKFVQIRGTAFGVRVVSDICLKRTASHAKVRVATLRRYYFERRCVCVEDCGGILTASTGVIQSPNYPERYPSNKRCEWRLVFPSSYIITLTFHEFDLEGRSAFSCAFDNVTIEDANERRVYCGLRFVKEPLTLENRVNLTFSSDDSLSRRGFRITYKAQPGTFEPVK